MMLKPDGQQIKAEMLHKALVALNSEGVAHCILHGYEHLNLQITSDIDMLVDPAVTVVDFVACVEATGLILVQHLQHESTCHYLVFVGKDRRSFIHLDISSDYRRNGVVFFSAEEILRDRRSYKNMWVPSPSHEFGYYLAKKIAKLALTDEHGKRLTELFTMDPNQIPGQVARLLGRGNQSTHNVTAAAESGDWQNVQDQLPKLRSEMLERVQANSRGRSVRYRISDTIRRSKRILQPTGVHVALLGPDGSGKSTIVNEIVPALASAFRRTSVQHLFPSGGESESPQPVVDPQAQPPRGSVQSIAKIGAWGFRYTAGYLRHIRSRMIRSTLVVSDRYFPDIIVDPKRYRYGGPAWVPKLMWRLLPKPDLVILLSAPTDVLQRRKQEVSFEETERQMGAYRDLVVGMKNGYIVNASQPVDEVVADVNRIILDFMSDRVHRRIGIKATPDG